jgi:hypothetical protein
VELILHSYLIRSFFVVFLLEDQVFSSTFYRFSIFKFLEQLLFPKIVMFVNIYIAILFLVPLAYFSVIPVVGFRITPPVLHVRCCINFIHLNVFVQLDILTNFNTKLMIAWLCDNASDIGIISTPFVTICSLEWYVWLYVLTKEIKFDVKNTFSRCVSVKLTVVTDVFVCTILVWTYSIIVFLDLSHLVNAETSDLIMVC